MHATLTSVGTSAQFQIFNTDGSSLKQLTNEGNNSQSAILSDGKWIVYVAEQEGAPTFWRISIDGGQSAHLTYISSSGPQIAPDGKQIAYTRDFHSIQAKSVGVLVPLAALEYRL